MLSIREYAKSVGHEVVGKLTRCARPEPCDYLFYMDEAGNEYFIDKNGVCICDAEGRVI